MLSPLRQSGSEGSASPAVRPPALSKTSTRQVDHLFTTLVEAAFDLMAELSQWTSLLAYLHVPHDEQPLLFLRQPRLILLSPTESFRLMHTITMLSNGRKPAAAFRHGELSGHYNRTTGARSDGLFVFGPIQTQETAARMTAISRAFARVLHQFHLDDEADPSPSPTPIIDIGSTSHQSTVTITVPVDGIGVQGTGTAARPEDAVAAAVFNAANRGDTVDEVRRIDVGARSAVLVAGHDAQGQLRLGLAISSGDILQTTATAASRALSDQ